MPFGWLVLLLALVTICSFAPGFLFIRRLRWTPLEKLCGSVGLSLILLYLAAWAIYCFGPRDQRPAYWAVAAACMVAAAAAWRDAVQLFRIARVRQTLKWFAFVAGSVLLMLSTIRVYSGAGWSGDWYEHFQRCLFFLDRLPTNVQIYPYYILPARPPLINVIAAYFMGVTRESFAVFQVVFAFVNILLFLPCALILPALGDVRRRGMAALAVLMVANPVIMQNATYTWTKSATALYVILALALYLSGWRKRDSGRTVAAFVALAAGLLVHYSAGPYIAFLVLHYSIRLFRERPFRWKELAGIAAACGLLLATWFGWSAKTYGMKATLGSNTSVTWSTRYEGSMESKIAANLFDSVVPGPFRGYNREFPQGSADGATRDRAFAWYQQNLIFGMGTVGGLAVLWLLYSRLLRGNATPERNFWLGMAPFCVVAGIAVVGERDPNGVPHLALISMTVLGVTLLASRFRRLPQVVQYVLIAGLCVDFYVGVLLHARVQSLENTRARTPYPELRFASGTFYVAGDCPYCPADDAWRAWMVKHRATLYPKWLNGLPAAHANDPQFERAWPAWLGFLVAGLMDDAQNWSGWGARHGDLVYLGDSVAGESGTGVDLARLLLPLLFVGGIVAHRAELLSPLAEAPARDSTLDQPREPSVKSAAADDLIDPSSQLKSL